MVPSARLLWLVGLLAFPAAVIAALHSDAQMPAYLIIAGCFAMAVLDAVLGRVALEGVDPVAGEPVRFYKDRSDVLQTLLKNSSGKSKQVKVAFSFPESFQPEQEELETTLAAEDGVYAVNWKLTPTRRGRYLLEQCYLETASTLGLWQIRAERPLVQEVRVYPNLRTPEGMLAMRKGLAGVHVQRQLGQGREFEKLRDYVAGDSYDEIHWKATARRSKPVSKVFQVERTQEIYIVMDASRLAQRPFDGQPVFEHYITAGLLAGAAAERNGDLFGLAVFSDKMHGFVRARNGKAHYAACRDAIYQIHPRPVSPDFEEIATFLRLNLRRRAMLLFLTQLDDPVIAESFLRATRMLSKQHLILAGVLAPPSLEPLFQSTEDVSTIDDIYARLGNHTAWHGLAQLQLELRRQGVRLALLEPGKAVEQLVKLYGEVKQRQIL